MALPEAFLILYEAETLADFKKGRLLQQIQVEDVVCQAFRC